MKDALKEDNNFLHPKIFTGYIYSQIAEYSKALDILQECLILSKTDDKKHEEYEIYLSMLKVYIEKGDYDKALNILDRAKKNKIPVIYAGSSSCTGDVYANPYTFSKWQNEELCNLYSKLFDVPTTICRFYNVYGEYQTNDGAYCNVLGIFERKYKPLTITGDGEQRRDFTYVGDIVDGLIRASQYKSDSLSEEFELGNGKNYSINELAEAFGDYPKEYIDARPGEMRVTLNTDTKAEDLLGWKPKGDIIKFVKENYILMK